MKNLGGKKESVAKKLKPEPDDKEQSSRFIAVARDLEVDKTGKSFEHIFQGILTPTKPTPNGQPKAPRKPDKP